MRAAARARDIARTPLIQGTDRKKLRRTQSSPLRRPRRARRGRMDMPSGSIGSIRRECLDHVVVFGEAHLRRVLKKYATYYNQVRTHLSLDKDAPDFRRSEMVGSIVATGKQIYPSSISPVSSAFKRGA